MFTDRTIKSSMVREVQLRIARIRRYLRISKVDLHDERDSHACGEGETGRYDDCQSVSLAGTAFCKGVCGGLPQGRNIVARKI